MAAGILPPLPYSDFPLRPHRNGQWYKSVWNRHTRKSEQFYFGPWRDDPKGERALKDPELGWFARKDAIRAGVDNVRVSLVNNPAGLTLGELMARFLVHKRNQVAAGDLSIRTLGDYIDEIGKFVSFQKPGTPVGILKPEHFSAYVMQLVEKRKLGRHSRKRVRAYINCYLHFGVKNGWYATPPTGVDWAAPATDPASLRQAKARAGLKDYSDRIFTGAEIDKLLNRATPSFKALILLGVNCGLGPSDLARLRWHMVDLERGRLIYPRPKTGVLRSAYLWKKTRAALNRVRSLKRNRQAIEREGDEALTFITREGRPYYRDVEQHREVEVDGISVKKLVGVRTENAISGTFRRMCIDLEIKGAVFYRLRHTLKTLGKGARDREALDLVMGHSESSIGKIYDHETVSWKRIRRVSHVVYRRLWPKVKPKEEMTRRGCEANNASDVVGGVGLQSQAA
jgi:integrase